MRERYGTLAQYKKVCAEIWEERGELCEDCHMHLGEPKYHNFHHTAGRRENFLNKKTIKLICFKCHGRHHGVVVKNGNWLA